MHENRRHARQVYAGYQTWSKMDKDTRWAMWPLTHSSSEQTRRKVQA
jgi:hypothetical protein